MLIKLILFSSFFTIFWNDLVNSSELYLALTILGLC